MRMLTRIAIESIGHGDGRRSASEVRERLLRIADQARARINERQETAVHPTVLLPDISKAFRTMPNHLARSSIFAPVARGRKQTHKGTEIVSRRDANIRFWGEQLDESQADVWMQAIYEATRRRIPLGGDVTVNRAAFLRAIGRDVGHAQYEWLKRAMEALAFAMLVIEVNREGETKFAIGRGATNGSVHVDASRVEGLHLIDSFSLDVSSNEYVLRIDPRWRVMYENNEFSKIDWEKRLRITRGNHMAKALQRLLAASSNSVQKFELEWLKSRMQYTSPMRKFRATLVAATDELSRVKIISRARIEPHRKGGEQLAIWMSPSV